MVLLPLTYDLLHKYLFVEIKSGISIRFLQKRTQGLGILKNNPRLCKG
jgi:hypothetical protein